MVASGRASVFILRAKSQTIKVFHCFFFRRLRTTISPQQKLILNVEIQAWDHAVGMICVHEAGGKVCYVTLFEKFYNLDFFPVYSTYTLVGISFNAFSRFRVGE